MNHRSLVFRLWALYTLLLSAAFALVAAATFYGLQHNLQRNVRDSLNRRAAHVQQILMYLPPETANGVIARELETRIAILSKKARIDRLDMGVDSNTSRLPRTLSSARLVAALTLRSKRPTETWNMFVIANSSRFAEVWLTLYTDSTTHRTPKAA